MLFLVSAVSKIDSSRPFVHFFKMFHAHVSVCRHSRSGEWSASDSLYFLVAYVASADTVFAEHFLLNLRLIPLRSPTFKSFKFVFWPSLCPNLHGSLSIYRIYIVYERSSASCHHFLGTRGKCINIKTERFKCVNAGNWIRNVKHKCS